MIKQLLSTLFFCFLISALWAQDAKRYVLLEHFTNTRCGICASRNPGFHDLIQQYEDQIHHVSFHPSFPYPNCELHLENPSENNARADYYTNLFGTPTVFADGQKGSGNTLVSTNQLEAAIAVSSPIAIRASENRAGGSQIDVNVSIETAATVAAGNYKLHVMLVEKVVDRNTPNGESKHYNVFRKYLTPVAGTDFSAADVDQSVSFDYNYEMDDSWVADQIYVLAYVQNTDTDKILNSGASIDEVVSSQTNASVNDRLAIYPNPATEMLYVQSPVDAAASLYNLVGRQVQTWNVKAESTGLGQRITDLPAGMYMLQLRWQDGQTTRRILIEKP